MAWYKNLFKTKQRKDKTTIGDLALAFLSKSWFQESLLVEENLFWNNCLGYVQSSKQKQCMNVLNAVLNAPKVYIVNTRMMLN